MSEFDYFDYDDVEPPERPVDQTELQAITDVRRFFEENRERVFSSRQVEVHFEDKYFHWVTHRAVKAIADEGTIVVQQRDLASGTQINLAWHRKNRYTQRPIKELMRLVESYSDPDFTRALGQHGELLVSDGFSRFQFVQRGRDTREFNGKKWKATEHNLDYIFERDGRAYGVEVKNTLPYMKDAERDIKIQLCEHLGITPLFVVRMMPRIWIQSIADIGGFVLILKYHLYPISHKKLAAEVKDKLGLPADAPSRLLDGTMQRFVNWHERQLK